MTSSCHFQKECRYSLQHICHKLRAVACSANIGLLLRHAGRSVTEIKREAIVISDQKKMLKQTQPGEEEGNEGEEEEEECTLKQCRPEQTRNRK